MAGSAYTVMAVAEEPTVDVEGDSFQENDTLNVDGTTYVFTGSEFEYEVTREQESSWDDGSTVEYDDGEYTVAVENESDPSRFGLREEFDVEGILQNDSEVENQTYEGEDGTVFVRYRDGETQPLEEYLPDPDVQVFAEGDTLEHDGQTKTVDNVSQESVTLVWEEQATETAGAEEGEVFELGDQEYVAHYPEEGTVVLSEDVEGYQQQADNQKFFQQRLSGLMYVVLFSLATSFLLAALAFIPRRG